MQASKVLEYDRGSITPHGSSQCVSIISSLFIGSELSLSTPYNHQAFAVPMSEITPNEQELRQCLGSEKVDERG
jgi:hypothetical protein